jgi:hypothetical protein
MSWDLLNTLAPVAFLIICFGATAHRRWLSERRQAWLLSSARDPGPDRPRSRRAEHGVFRFQRGAPRDLRRLKRVCDRCGLLTRQES